MHIHQHSVRTNKLDGCVARHWSLVGHTRLPVTRRIRLIYLPACIVGMVSELWRTLLNE